MGVLRWIGRHWYIPLLALVGLVGFLVGSRRTAGVVGDELKAIDAGEKARRDAIDRGADAANAEADRKYQTQIAQMDAKQMAKADRLRGDHARRIRFLERISRRQR